MGFSGILERLNAPFAAAADSLRGVFSLPHPNVEEHEPDLVGSRRGHGVMFDRFADTLPYLTYDPQTQLFALAGAKPGEFEGVGYVIEITPQVGANQQMAEYLVNLICGTFPTGTGIQSTLFGSPIVDHLTDGIIKAALDPEQSSRPQQAAVLKRMAQRRAEFLLAGATGSMHAGSNLRVRTYRGWMSVVIPAKDPTAESTIETALAARQLHIATLNQFHLFQSIWNAEDLIHTLGAILNPHRFLRSERPLVNYDDEQEIRYQLVSPDTKLDVEENRVTFSSRKDRSDGTSVIGMSVRSYPRAFSLHMMSQVLGSLTSSTMAYPCPFLITCGCQIPDQEKEKNRTLIKSAHAVRSASTDMARFLPRLKEVAADWEIAQHAFDNGKGTAQMYHQVLLFADYGKEMEAEEAARSIWREAGFELTADMKMHEQSLLSGLPMLNGPLLSRDLKVARRVYTKTAYNVVNMMPLIAEWQGTPARLSDKAYWPVFSPVARLGQLMYVDPWANPSGNMNGIIVGASGSGKSATLNEICRSILSEGGRVWIFDQGKSYLKLVRLLSGEFVEFTDDNPIGLNPFALVPDVKVFETDIEMIKQVIAQMCSFEKPLDAYELAQLEIHIRSVYYDSVTEGRVATITDLAESLKNNCYLGGPNPQATDAEWRAKVDAMTHEERAAACDPRVRALGVQLFPFTADGGYGKYFNGSATIDFKSNFICLELDELQTRPHLQAVVMQLLMYKISNAIYLGTRERPSAMVIDEAWSLLGAGSAGRFIENLYRKVRRYNGACFTATQSCQDYFKSETARACFENADVMLLLRQKSESIDQLVESKRISLDEHQLNLLKSVTTIQGRYSEVFIKVGDLPVAIGRQFLDPYSLLVYSSRAEDFAAVMSYAQRGYSMADAIDAVLADRAHPQKIAA